MTSKEILESFRLGLTQGMTMYQAMERFDLSEKGAIYMFDLSEKISGPSGNNWADAPPPVYQRPPAVYSNRSREEVISYYLNL